MSAYNGFKNHVTLSKHPARGEESSKNHRFYLEPFNTLLSISIDITGFSMKRIIFP